jgi:hypothetical protein
MIVELLGFAPDADQNIVGVLTNCSGVVPSFKGMKGAPTPADTPMTSLGATCMGSALLTKLDATNRLIAGTAQKMLVERRPIRLRLLGGGGSPSRETFLLLLTALTPSKPQSLLGHSHVWPALL